MRMNEANELLCKAIRTLLNNDLFKDVYVTTKNQKINNLLAKNKAVILLNIAPDSEKERYMDHSISLQNFKVKTYFIGNYSDRDYIVDIIDKITEDLYQDVTDLDKDVVYTDFKLSYESVPDRNNVFYFCGIIKLEKND